jgi:hypothetical protein
MLDHAQVMLFSITGQIWMVQLSHGHAGLVFNGRWCSNDATTLVSDITIQARKGQPGITTQCGQIKNYHARKNMVHQPTKQHLHRMNMREAPYY